MTDFEKIKASLDKLVEQQENTSKMHRFYKLLPEIEKAQEAGIGHQAILDVLNDQGFAISLKSYSVMLSRARKRRAKSPPKTKASKTSVAQPLREDKSSSDVSSSVQRISRDGILDPPRLVWDPNRKVDW